MRAVEAQYEKGLLRPTTPLSLRQGERVHLIVVREPDPRRWDLARLAKGSSPYELTLTEEGLDSWATKLDEEDLR